MLIDLFATDRVESLCGYKPNPDQVLNFLSKELVLLQVQIKIMFTKKLKLSPQLIEIPQQTGFELFGEFYPEDQRKRLNDSYSNLISRKRSNFSKPVCQLPKHGRTRRYLLKIRRP